VSRPDVAYIALALTPGIGAARLSSLLARFGTAAAAIRAPSDALMDVPGISRAAATAIRKADAAHAERLIARTAEVGGRPLTPDDPDFPPALRVIPDPPTLLFAAGNVAHASSLGLAVVGSRSHTRYGAEVCRHLAGGAARAGITIVSGMARGIDGLAHTAALDVGGATIGVLGNGLGVVYPSANRALYDRMREHGLLVTEFPPGDRPNAGSFQRRNRLISGLARATLVVEAREKSGAFITVDCALAQGREVLAVPGPITSPASLGCNRLIQSGAKPALGLRDVLEEFHLTVTPLATTALPVDLSSNARRLLSQLQNDSHHVDHLAAALALSSHETLALLTDLELRGLIEPLPGKVFRLANGDRRLQISDC
jgi:DNA processing protein